MKKQLKKALEKYGERISIAPIKYKIITKAEIPEIDAVIDRREARVYKWINLYGNLIYDVEIRGAWAYGWDAE